MDSIYDDMTVNPDPRMDPTYNPVKPIENYRRGLQPMNYFNPMDWIRVLGAYLGWWSVAIIRVSANGVGNVDKQIRVRNGSLIIRVLRKLADTGIQDIDELRHVKITGGWHIVDSTCTSNFRGQGWVDSWKPYKLTKDDQNWLTVSNVTAQLLADQKQKQMEQTGAAGLSAQIPLGMKYGLTGSIGSAAGIGGSAINYNPTLSLSDLQRTQQRIITEMAVADGWFDDPPVPPSRLKTPKRS